MQIHIDNDQKLESIKAAFSELFPFLKLEFFKKAHSEGDSSPKSEMITEDLLVGEIRNESKEGVVELGPELKVGELEQLFEDEYGIHAQVFRKSGDLWLETSATDQWTLKEQNETGKEMS